MIKASAPAKVNLYFAVGPIREDGYHEVCSVYLSLNLREFVSVEYSDKPQITIMGTLSQDELESVPTDESNLAAKAGRAITDRPLRFEITKNVPVAGGMAGGSADAAAALVATMTLAEVTDFKDAVSLGADIPFAIAGGVAVGLGVGEVLTQVAFPGELHVVLITNPMGLSTGQVYATLDKLREQENLEPESLPLVPTELLSALESANISEVARMAQNDLQRAALWLRPELQETIDLAITHGALTAMVSGSGPTIFAIAESLESAQKIAAAFPHGRALVTSGPGLPARLEN